MLKLRGREEGEGEKDSQGGREVGREKALVERGGVGDRDLFALPCPKRETEESSVE